MSGTGSGGWGGGEEVGNGGEGGGIKIARHCRREKTEKGGAGEQTLTYSDAASGEEWREAGWGWGLKTREERRGRARRR